MCSKALLILDKYYVVYKALLLFDNHVIYKAQLILSTYTTPHAIYSKRNQID